MVVPVRDGTIGMEGAAGRCDPTAKRLFRLLEERSEVVSMDVGERLALACCRFAG